MALSEKSFPMVDLGTLPSIRATHFIYYLFLSETTIARDLFRAL